MISGALSAVAATLMSAQILSIDPLAGNLLELDAIAAVVIGGASLYGGRGTIIGTLIGVFIMVMIRNGLNLLGVSPFWQGSAIGGDHHRRGFGGAAAEPENAPVATPGTPASRKRNAMHVLITGAAGMIGRKLTASLVGAGGSAGAESTP